jgi:hypothetical protein
MNRSIENSFRILLLAVGVGVLVSHPASAAFPGENGKIAMGCSTLRVAICVTEPGSHVTTVLTDSGKGEYMPSFSANGRRIVFQRQVGPPPDTHGQIFVMRANGTQAERLTHSGAGVNNAHPSFTPDGSQIVFQRGRGRIMIMDADGSGVEQIGQGFAPAVSPTGERVAFVRDDDPELGGTHLYTMALDGSDVDPVAGPGDIWTARDPGWSPDGEEIVFTYYDRPTSEQGIFSVPASGGDPDRISPELLPGEGDRAFEPTFSPDGARVAFLATDCAGAECPHSLLTSALDGSGITRLGFARPGAYPDWGVRTGDGPPLRGRCNGKAATIVGTNRDDSIFGTSSRDIISARRGSDLIQGLEGNDLLCAGQGRDRIEAGPGRDRVEGGPGRDRCNGGRGRDRMRACEPGPLNPLHTASATRRYAARSR